MEYNGRLSNLELGRLCEAILSLKTEEECLRFLDDLCTMGEVKALAARFRAVEMLDSGATYDEIVAETGMSSATIARIKQFLEYGASGYRLVLDRLKEPEK